MGPTSATLVRLRRTWMKGERETNFLSDGQKLRCRAILPAATAELLCFCRGLLLLCAAALLPSFRPALSRLLNSPRNCA